MATYFFFDDVRLLVRENMERRIGRPERIEDSRLSVYGGYPCPAMGRVWKENEHSYHLFYHAYVDKKSVTLAAHSEDGIHFRPRNTAAEAGIEDPIYPNQLLPDDDMEIFSFIDTGKGPGRLKLLISQMESDRYGMDSSIYVSDDGVHWDKQPQKWHEVGTEPVGSVLYSSFLSEYVVLSRPMWGVRRVCASRTKDFVTFTPPEIIMEADAFDKPLQETYGLVGCPYKDMYVGIVNIFSTVESDTWKFYGGHMEGQLCYSYTGAAWMRSLRDPLLSLDEKYTGMIFGSDMRVADDGSVLIYASATNRNHGYDTYKEGIFADMFVYRLREDGFISLYTEAEGRVRTRETQLKNGFDVNIRAKKATCGLFTTKGEPIEGFTHEDCEPFSGDDTHWKPKFARDISELRDRIVCIELKIEDGDLWSINGDFIKFYNTETWRYNNRGGIMPHWTNP